MRGWTSEALPKRARVVLGANEPILPANLIEPNIRRGQREIVVQREIEAMLMRAGCVVTVTDATMVFGYDGKPRKRVSTGWPDVTACGPQGRFLAFETKAGRNGLSPLQVRTLGLLWAAGGIVAVPRTLGFAANVVLEAYAPFVADSAVRRLLDVVRAHAI